MTVPDVWPQVLNFFGTPLVIEPSAGQLSCDAGLLPIRQLDQRLGLTRAFAETLDDPRDPDLTEHTFLEMVRGRVCGRPCRHAQARKECDELLESEDRAVLIVLTQVLARLVEATNR
jgi:hypothetical protein